MPAKTEAVRIEIPSRFKVNIDREHCKICKRCTINCTFGALSFNGERIVSIDDNCVACQRCVMKCPQEAITGKKKKPHQLDQKKCIKCGICYDACKFNAIAIR